MRLELRKMRGRFRLFLDDQPGHLGALAQNELADRAAQCRAVAGLTLDDSSLGAGADTHGKAHMHLAAGLQVLQFDRLFQRYAIGDVDEIAVGDKGGVQCTDGVIAAIGIEARRNRAVGQLFRQALDGHTFDRGEFRAGDAVQHGQDGGAFDDGRQRLGRGRRIECWHRRQQAAQIRIVPGFDAPSRQAVLDRLDGVVALQRHRAVARQQRQPLAESVDQRRFGLGALGCRVNVHQSSLWHLTRLRRSRRHSHWLRDRAPATCRRT